MRWLLVAVLGCGTASAPPPQPPEPLGPVPEVGVVGDAGAEAAGGAYRGPIALRPLLADLIAQGKAATPTAAALRTRYAGLAKSMELAGPNLSHPAWVVAVNGEADVFFALGGDVIGLQLWEDHGPYVELAVAKGTLADAEAVIGPTQEVPGNRDDATAGPRVAAYVGSTRVFVELAKQGKDVRRVMIHFEQ